jgi:hypothetical protein
VYALEVLTLSVVEFRCINGGLLPGRRPLRLDGDEPGEDRAGGGGGRLPCPAESPLVSPLLDYLSYQKIPYAKACVDNAKCKVLGEAG